MYGQGDLLIKHDKQTIHICIYWILNNIHIKNNNNEIKKIKVNPHQLFIKKILNWDNLLYCLYVLLILELMVFDKLSRKP